MEHYYYYYSLSNLKEFIKNTVRKTCFTLCVGAISVANSSWTYCVSPRMSKSQSHSSFIKDENKPTPNTVKCAICRNVKETYVETEDGHYLCFGCWDSEVDHGKLSAHERILAWNAMREYGELVDKTGVISITYPFPSHVGKCVWCSFSEECLCLRAQWYKEDMQPRLCQVSTDACR